MSYNILTIPPFDNQLKRLAKKYPSLKSDFTALLEILESKPDQGKAIGKNCYKIRLAISSKGKGKRGGARVIINIVVSETIVYLLTIYDKADKENLTDKELKELLQFVPD
jgi:mRNA-degrading endonuclease RelE of RelBE toxin-antitoxin system